MHPVFKIVLPSAAITATLLLAKYRYRYSIREDLQLRKPKFTTLTIWLSIAIAWMLLTDAFLQWRGPWDFSPWKAQPVWVSIIRIAAVCLLGPIAEELIFRGLLFRRITNSFKISPWFAIVIISILWSCLHYNYSISVIAVIFVEGVFLGAALIHSRSLFVPIAMHVAWNLYAVW